MPSTSETMNDTLTTIGEDDRCIRCFPELQCMACERSVSYAVDVMSGEVDGTYAEWGEDEFRSTTPASTYNTKKYVAPYFVPHDNYASITDPSLRVATPSPRRRYTRLDYGRRGLHLITRTDRRAWWGPGKT